MTTTIERFQGATAAYKKESNKIAANGVLKQGAALVSNADACATQIALSYNAGQAVAQSWSAIVELAKAAPAATTPAQLASSIENSWNGIRDQFAATYHLSDSDLTPIDNQVKALAQQAQSLGLTAIQAKIANAPSNSASASTSAAFGALKQGIVNATIANRSVSTRPR